MYVRRGGIERERGKEKGRERGREGVEREEGGREGAGERKREKGEYDEERYWDGVHVWGGIVSGSSLVFFVNSKSLKPFYYYF